MEPANTLPISPAIHGNAGAPPLTQRNLNGASLKPTSDRSHHTRLRRWDVRLSQHTQCCACATKGAYYAHAMWRGLADSHLIQGHVNETGINRTNTDSADVLPSNYDGLDNTRQ